MKNGNREKQNILGEPLGRSEPRLNTRVRARIRIQFSGELQSLSTPESLITSKGVITRQTCGALYNPSHFDLIQGIY